LEKTGEKIKNLEVAKKKEELKKPLKSGSAGVPESL